MNIFRINSNYVKWISVQSHRRDWIYLNQKKKKTTKLCAPLMDSAVPNVTSICIPAHSYIYRTTHTRRH